MALKLKRNFKKSMTINGIKKLRGWRAKQFFNVKVTDITADGFWIHNEGDSFYISRKKYPWFLDATDKEIRDVHKIMDMTALHEKDIRDCLEWTTLDMDIAMTHIRHPETLKVYGVYVRGEQRPDLFARSDWNKPE
jgi:hypothetical protein